MAEGHRERLRKRFQEENIDTIPEYIVLERMLHGIITRRDTCELARTLINEFGSLAQVIDAPIHELCKVPGMGETAASYVKLVPLFYRKYCQSKWAKNAVFKSVEDTSQYLRERFIGYQNEVLIAMCLDVNCKLLSCKAVFEGSLHSLDISTRKIVDFAIASNASRVIIAHNHVQGSSAPSEQDFEATKIIYNALSYVNIILDDHIIISSDDFTSLAQAGFVPNSTFSKK